MSSPQGRPWSRLPFDPDAAPSTDEPSTRTRRLDDRSPRRSALRRGVGPVLAVSAGGVVGGGGRYLVDVALPMAQRAIPWSTLSVNVIGAFLLALLLVLMLDVWRPTAYVRVFLAVGALGSFTTFSTLIVEVDLLYAQGAAGVATTHLLASILGGLAATSAGLVIGRGVASRRRVADPQQTEEELCS